MALAAATERLGAPGVFVTSPSPVREITGVRRDIAAFVGVAPRGPAWLPAVPLEPDVDVATWLATAPRQRSVPVRVSSWDEYRHHFGGFDGPGRLPYAVASFFAQGGREAYVVRVVHDDARPPADLARHWSGVLGTVALRSGEDVRLFARSEGTWGRGLRATLRFAARPVAAETIDLRTLVVDRREWVPQGSLVRSTLSGDVRELRYVDASTLEDDPVGHGVHRRLVLEAPLAATPDNIEVVTASLEVFDVDPSFTRQEVLDDIGMRVDHPRWLARVIAVESGLVWPGVEWSNGTIDGVDPSLDPVALIDDGGPPTQLDPFVDQWDTIVPEDFWDHSWVPGDENVGGGVHCLVDHDDIGLLVAPDLYDPLPVPALDDVTDPPTLCGPDFAEHVPLPPTFEPPPPPIGLDGLRLDPLDSLERRRIVSAQSELVAFAEARRDLTVLLDVPPGLDHRRIMTWRTAFESPFAAAYHPWLDTAPVDDGRNGLVRLNPSAFAAGIIADRELRLGVHFGPANQIAEGAVRPTIEVRPDHHDELHVNGVNVFEARRDGIELTGARTLSRRNELRQLSVARLMTVLRLSLQREMQWAVFEPSNRELWAEVRRLVHTFLGRLFEAGAFAGASAKEAFFVRCDDTTMTRSDLDNGRLVCLVGVAPAEPVEYIVVELALAADTGVSASLR